MAQEADQGTQGYDVPGTPDPNASADSTLSADISQLGTLITQQEAETQAQANTSTGATTPTPATAAAAPVSQASDLATSLASLLSAFGASDSSGGTGGIDTGSLPQDTVETPATSGSTGGGTSLYLIIGLIVIAGVFVYLHLHKHGKKPVEGEK